MKKNLIKKWSMVCFTLALIFSFNAWSPSGQAKAASPASVAEKNSVVMAAAATDDAPYIEPTVVNEHAGQKVLFDNTHGQTAGAADWVINGGFSDFGNSLADDGYYVKELRQSTPLTYDDLKDYDVFVIGEANIPYKTSEQDAMLEYVNNGGSIFFIADHYNADRNKNRWDASEVFNGYRRGAYADPAKGMGDAERNSEAMQGVKSSDWLGDNFGIRYRYNALSDITADHIVSPDQSFGITEGVDTAAMHAGSTLAILDPHHAKGIVYLPETNAAWSHAVDQGNYDGGGVAEGAFAAISKVGAGKAAFIGDSSPVEDASPKYLKEETGDRKTTYDGFKEQDDATLLVNMVEWLSKSEDYTSFDGKVNLDDQTQLLDFETPEDSTEPEAEPWSSSVPGYKWWDSSTFKPGSFGSGQEATNPTYSFVHQSELPGNEKVFQIRVAADQLAPSTVVDNLKVGLYLPGGEQIGQFSTDGENWPSDYGYSSPFTMISEATGHASRDLYVKVKANKLGQASLRLKQGSKTLYTESVRVSDVAAEPLPDDENGAVKLVDINEARSGKVGNLFKVEGVITTEPGLFGAQGFYLQDDTGGIYVFQSQSGFHEGDKVTVTAKLDEFNSELELTSPIIEKTGTEPLPESRIVTTLTDDNQGQIVTLKNMAIKNIQKVDNFGTIEFSAVNDDTSILVRIDNRTGLDFDHFSYKNGDVLNITGVSSKFKGAYQLKPRGSSDLEWADKAAPVTTEKVDCEQLSDGSCLDSANVTLDATDEGTGVDKTEFKINGGEWTTYQSPIELDKSGDINVVYRSIDKVGNVEEAQHLSLTVTGADIDHLKKWIDKADITPNGLKKSFNAHLRTAERHEQRARDFGIDSKKGQKEWGLRNKTLQKDLNKIEGLSNTHITEVSRHDLKLFYQHLIKQ